MLFDSLTRSAPDEADQPAVITADGTASWSDLTSLIQLRREQLASLTNQTVAVALPATADGIATLAALDGLRTSVYLLDEQRSTDDHRAIASQFDIAHLLTAPASEQKPWEIESRDKKSRGTATDEPSNDSPHVTIMTSGTEGTPKAAAHTWESLSRPVRQSGPAGEQRWLLSYRVQLYAGLQVTLQALLNRGTLIIPTPGCSPEAVVDLMLQGNVNYASATPSYWRRLLLFADRTQLAKVPIRQITLGGEASDQQLLDSLAETFPESRIAHIYATTELGRCFSVTDGKAGFPASYLETPTSDGVELRIDDDQLFVRSANAMRGYQNSTAGSPAAPTTDWFPTGDLVQVANERVQFAGRVSEMINVGGNKVRPLIVEKIIRSVNGIADARVFAKESSIAGQLVACQLVAAPDQDPDALKQAVAAACADQLPTYQRPRFIEVVAQIDLTTAGKTKRA